MEEPKVCEWGQCQKEPKILIGLDGEEYWFCDEHVDAFWDSVKDNY